jgi:hypothetical protein
MEESWFRLDRKRLVWFGWMRAGFVRIARDRFGLDGRELLWFDLEESMFGLDRKRFDLV